MNEPYDVKQLSAYSIGIFHLGIQGEREQRNA